MSEAVAPPRVWAGMWHTLSPRDALVLVLLLRACDGHAQAVLCMRVCVACIAYLFFASCSPSLIISVRCFFVAPQWSFLVFFNGFATFFSVFHRFFIPYALIALNCGCFSLRCKLLFIIVLLLFHRVS